MEQLDIETLKGEVHRELISKLDLEKLSRVNSGQARQAVASMVNEIIIGLLRAVSSDDRHLGIVEDGIALRRPEHRRGPGDRSKPVLTASYLRRIGCRIEFTGIGPDDHR